jgi:hypothetical protein
MQWAYIQTCALTFVYQELYVVSGATFVNCVVWRSWGYYTHVKTSCSYKALSVQINFRFISLAPDQPCWPWLSVYPCYVLCWALASNDTVTAPVHWVPLQAQTRQSKRKTEHYTPSMRDPNQVKLDELCLRWCMSWRPNMFWNARKIRAPMACNVNV